jgi:hypothetical protein
MVISSSHNQDLVGGELIMSEFIWYWTKENKKILTTQTDLAEQAMKDGFFVMGTLLRPGRFQ